MDRNVKVKDRTLEVDGNVKVKDKIFEIMDRFIK